MYPDYNNMYNQFNNLNLNARANQPPQMTQPQMQQTQTPQVTDEIITLQEALNSIKESVSNEREDEMFYDEIIKQAPTEKEKRIITSIRDDERKHNRILRSVYLKFTGQTLPQPAMTTNVNTTKRTYAENLENALFGELAAVVRYRRIMGAMPDNDSYTLIMSIMTDEIRHACKYNYLIHNAAKR